MANPKKNRFCPRGLLKIANTALRKKLLLNVFWWRDTSVTWRDKGVTWRDTSVTWRDKNLHAVNVPWPSRDITVTVPWLYRYRELDRDRYRDRDRDRDRYRYRDRLRERYRYRYRDRELDRYRYSDRYRDCYRYYDRYYDRYSDRYYDRYYDQNIFITLSFMIKFFQRIKITIH